MPEVSAGCIYWENCWHEHALLHLGCQLTINSTTTPCQWHAYVSCPPFKPEIRSKIQAELYTPIISMTSSPTPNSRQRLSWHPMQKSTAQQCLYTTRSSTPNGSRTYSRLRKIRNSSRIYIYSLGLRLIVGGARVSECVYANQIVLHATNINVGKRNIVLM